MTSGLRYGYSRREREKNDEYTVIHGKVKKQQCRSFRVPWVTSTPMTHCIPMRMVRSWYTTLTHVFSPLFLPLYSVYQVAALLSRYLEYVGGKEDDGNAKIIQDSLQVSLLSYFV